MSTSRRYFPSCLEQLTVLAALAGAVGWCLAASKAPAFEVLGTGTGALLGEAPS